MSKRLINCLQCNKILNQEKYISPDNKELLSFCSFDCFARSECQRLGKVLKEDVIFDKFTDMPAYNVDCEWRYLEGNLQRYLDTYNLDLDPDFQRAHVWTEAQQIAFVEYIMRGGHAGKVLYFNYPNWQKDFSADETMVIVDGKQRLNAVMRFIKDEITVFGGYKWSNFLYKDMSWSFRIYINSLATRKEVLKWYLDLNTGGTPHTSEEIQKVKDMLEQEKG